MQRNRAAIGRGLELDRLAGRVRIGELRQRFIDQLGQPRNAPTILEVSSDTAVLVTR